MKVAGIIAEFNPFHKGHTLPIIEARRTVGETGHIVCIMSGNCVQRGDLAVFHKKARAQAAIRCGADLVIELPASYVLGSAEKFARGGVALLASFGIEDVYLAFGCETADAVALREIARELDTSETGAKIKAGMAEGLPYGTACQQALKVTNMQADLLQTPNNLLAIEYLRAIHRLGAHIKPLPIKRQGVSHDSETARDGYASASHLRTLFHGGKAEEVWDYMPEAAAEIFRRELVLGRGPAETVQLEQTILTLLRLGRTPDGGYLDDSEGLSKRITNIAAETATLEELLQAVKTKRYHLSRIRRLILGMCLGLSPTDRPQIPPYIRPLAASENGQTLLRQITKTATLPILSRAGQVKKLDSATQRVFAIESAVTDLQALCFRTEEHRRGGSEWRSTIFVGADSISPG